jgi:CubicO group peptidase (beta-lactamase class C family)
VAGAATDATPTATPAATPAVISPALTALTEQWLATSGISGVRVAVVTPDGSSLFAGSGTNGDGSPMNVDSSTAVTSITKTMTGAITMQLVDEGLLDLDAPMTSIPGAGEIPGGATITIRQLLNHSSGLAPYQETPTYDSSTSLDPLTAVQMALTTDLQWAPGSKAGYSNTGFLTLGLLVENATGQDYETVLAERILEPYGLFGTSVDTTPRRGWIGDSAGGVSSTVNDLAAWGAHLYRDGDVVSPGSLAQMTAIDELLYAGLGTFPVCPCTPNGDGTVGATSYGHNSGPHEHPLSPPMLLKVMTVITRGDNLPPSVLNRCSVAVWRIGNEVDELLDGTNQLGGEVSKCVDLVAQARPEAFELHTEFTTHPLFPRDIAVVGNVRPGLEPDHLRTNTGPHVDERVAGDQHVWVPNGLGDPCLFGTRHEMVE